MENPKILITGGAGYIGTKLIPLLLERKYELTVFDALLFDGNVLLPFFQNKNFSFIKGDIRDKAALASACKGKDIIIHLAAIVGFPACRENPTLAYSTNVEGAKNLAEVVNKDQYVLISSTGSNYGALVDKICTEETPLNPLSIYGKTVNSYFRSRSKGISFVPMYPAPPVIKIFGFSIIYKLSYFLTASIM